MCQERTGCDGIMGEKRPLLDLFLLDLAACSGAAPISSSLNVDCRWGTCEMYHDKEVMSSTVSPHWPS